MRVTEYRTVWDENCIISLEKIRSKNVINIDVNLDTPEKIYKLSQAYFDFDVLTEEYVFMLCLNNKMRLLSVFEISHGDICQSFLSPISVFQKALLSNAANIILIHNHPSGDPSPSTDDIVVTKNLKEAGELLKIHLIDHIIVGFNNYISLREYGCL